MRRRISYLGALVLVLAATGCASGVAEAGSSTSRATPVGSTLGWFAAINAHNRQRLLSYVAPSAEDQMGWARPNKSWSNPDTLWDIYLHHSDSGWLIDSYGQG